MKETLKLALQVLEYWDVQGGLHQPTEEAITAIKAALAQPAQQEPVAWSSYEYDGIHHKPVAWMDADGNVSDNNDHKCFPIPLYTITHPTPPQRTWVDLKPEDRLCAKYMLDAPEGIEAVIDYITAKLKELNT